MEQAVSEFIDSVSRLDTIDGFRDAMDRWRLAYGFNHFAYLGLAIPRANLQAPFILSSYSEEWVNHYREKEYHTIDPVVTTANRSILPINWCDCEMDEVQRRFFAEAHEFGIGANGMTIPVRGPDGELAMVSVSAPVDETEWRKREAEFRHTLHVMAHYYHMALVENLLLKAPEHPLGADAPVLTPRELECLKWAAIGKTAWETGEILRISERTVIFHLNNAKQKLGVYTKNHAVVKAMMMGLVKP